MSYVIAAPQYVAAAATDLANIGSAISDAGAAAFGPTTGVLAPAGADVVSAQIAALFGAHAEAFQALSAQANQFHNQFVQLMSMGAQQYGLTEAANNSSIQAEAAVPQQTLGRSVLNQGAAVAPAVAQVAAISGSSGPGGSATTSAVPVGSSGSAVAARSVGSVTRQPISPLRTIPEEVVEVEASPMSALPAPLAARAAPAAQPSPVARAVSAEESVAVHG